LKRRTDLRGRHPGDPAGRIRFSAAPNYNYLPGPDDIYVSPSQIRRFNLRTGDTVSGQIRQPKESERYFALLKVEAVNYEDPEVAREKILFDNLTPCTRTKNQPGERPGKLFRPDHGPADAHRFRPARADRFAAPLRQNHAAAVHCQQHYPNHKDIVLFVLLIDERPEEVTDMQRSVKGEVISSTFDEPAERHVQVAEMVIEKAKRLVEHKKNVVILLDSITRLARAYNSVMPPSGKILVRWCGLQRPAAAQAVFRRRPQHRGGGSLTIIATALVDTGSRMDEVIFEEFKGTGNMEIQLDRRLADKRIFPAIDIKKSGTRKEELLLDEATLNRVWILRKLLSSLNPSDSLEFLLEKMNGTKDNNRFPGFNECIK
jgi:transcription termination factor Rho